MYRKHCILSYSIGLYCFYCCYIIFASWETPCCVGQKPAASKMTYRWFPRDELRESWRGRRPAAGQRSRLGQSAQSFSATSRGPRLTRPIRRMPRDHFLLVPLICGVMASTELVVSSARQTRPARPHACSPIGSLHDYK